MQCVLTTQKSPLLSNSICCVTSQPWQMGRSLRVARKTKRTFVDNSSSNALTKLAGLHSGPRTQTTLGNVAWKAQSGFVKGEAGTTSIQKWIRSITVTATRTLILYRTAGKCVPVFERYLKPKQPNSKWSTSSRSVTQAKLVATKSQGCFCDLRGLVNLFSQSVLIRCPISFIIRD